MLKELLLLLKCCNIFSIFTASNVESEASISLGYANAITWEWVSLIFCPRFVTQRFEDSLF